MAQRCPVDPEQWRRDHRIQLHPGKLQRWLVALRAPREATDDDLRKQLLHAFAVWRAANLIPAGTEEPELAERVAPPEVIPFAVREPTHWVIVEFHIDGSTATDLGVPTLVQRRRERIPETCPAEPIDTAPVFALEPKGALLVRRPEVEPVDRAVDPGGVTPGLPNAGDIGAGLRKAGERVAQALTLSALVGAIGTVVVLVSRGRKSRR